MFVVVVVQVVPRVHQSSGRRELTAGAQGRQLSGEEQRKFQARLLAVSQVSTLLITNAIIHLKTS